MLDQFEKAPALTKEREEELLIFQQNIGVKFNDLKILNQALTHTSYSNENSHSFSNERYEFLGDSVLGVITADYLFQTIPVAEGELSRIKSAVVSEESLNEVALQLNIPPYLLMGKGEEKMGGRNKKAILADSVEAIIAAIFIDSGIEPAKNFILSFITSQINKVRQNQHSFKDYKSQLQEYLQKKRGKVPEYRLIKSEGPDHSQVFYVEVLLGNKVFGPEKGLTKKQAEQEAAKTALEKLGIIAG